MRWFHHAVDFCAKLQGLHAGKKLQQTGCKEILLLRVTLIRRFLQLGLANKLERMAYSTVVDKAAGDHEIAHIYCTMGLEKQHHFQQVILARFKDFTIAAHFLFVVCSVLAVSFRAELRSVVESMNA